jgi:hypothetical protein
MNTFPLALSQKLEGEGKRFELGGEAATDFGMRSRVASRPAGQDFFPWSRAARRGEPPMRWLAICDDA